MIVVLAVVLGLASAALVPMIRHLDLLAQKKEEQTLKTMADAFKARIRVTKVITNQVGWANAIATQLGLFR